LSVATRLRKIWQLSGTRGTGINPRKAGPSARGWFASQIN
jgi:hypothetical protein